MPTLLRFKRKRGTPNAPTQKVRNVNLREPRSSPYLRRPFPPSNPPLAPHPQSPSLCSSSQDPLSSPLVPVVSAKDTDCFLTGMVAFDAGTTHSGIDCSVHPSKKSRTSRIERKAMLASGTVDRSTQTVRNNKGLTMQGANFDI